jgi:hypothetical protein
VWRSFNPTITSCDSLVRVCISLNTHQAVRLQFFPWPDFNWVHLAEVVFIGNSSTCPPDTIITTPKPDTTKPRLRDTTTPPPPDTTADCSGRVKSGKVIVYTGTIAKATTCGREQ